MGVPIACSKGGVMEEIAGTAVNYFDSNNIEDITRVFGEMMVDDELKNKLSKKSIERARDFPDREGEAKKTFEEIRKLSLS
jgi:hypothetical protein